MRQHCWKQDKDAAMAKTTPIRVADSKLSGDSIILYFETTTNQINAYTLASTLVAIADAAKAAKP